MKKTYFTIVAVMLMLLLGACSSHQPQENSSSPDSAITVSVAHATGSHNGQVDLSGQIASSQTSVISTRVMGYITAMHVQVGDHVRQGQLLVSINSQDISARRAQINATIASAEAAFGNAKKDLDRFTVLYKQQSASQKELDNVTLQYKAAQSQLRAAREMRNEVAASLNYTNITAPFTGVITQKMVDAGSMANPGMPLLTLEKASSYQVSAYLTENEVGFVKEGMPIVINVPATEKIISSHISQLSRSGETTGGQYLVKAEIPDTEKSGIYAGMYATISITLPKATIAGSDDQLLVPVSAIIHQDELTGLYIVGTNGTAQLRWVRLGKTADGQADVLSGLNSNETFITYANGRLYNGAPVKVK